MKLSLSNRWTTIRNFLRALKPFTKEKKHEERSIETQNKEEEKQKIRQQDHD